MMTNISSLLYMSGVTILFLSIIGLCRTILYSQQSYVGYAIFAANFILGPFALPFMLKMINTFHFRCIFFCTAIANIANTVIYFLVLKYMKDYLAPIYIILGILISPLLSIYYCTYNYYIKSLASKNEGTLFGAGYSMFSMSTIFGLLYIHFQDDLIGLDLKFYGILLGIASIISGLYWFIRDPNPESEPLSINIESNLAAHIFGSIDSDIQIQDIDYSYSAQFKLIWTLPKVLKDFYLLIPNLIFMGSIGGYILSFSNNLYLDGDYRLILMNCLLYHGVGQFIGGITSGVLSDLYDYLKVLIILQFWAIITFTQAFFALHIDQSKKLNYSFQFFIGVLISGLEATTYAFYASQYNKNSQMLIFCNWIYCISFGMSTIIFVITSNYEPTSYGAVGLMTAFTLFNFACIWIFRRRLLKDKK